MRYVDTSSLVLPDGWEARAKAALAEVAALEADQAPDVAPLADLLARLYDTHRSGFDPVRLVAQYREWRGLFVSGARQEVA